MLIINVKYYYDNLLCTRVILRDTWYCDSDTIVEQFGKHNSSYSVNVAK